MNYMKDIAALLGVQLNEEFKIVDENNEVFLNTYTITEDGLLNCDRHYECDLSGLLIGDWQIQKIPFKPKYGEIYYALETDVDGSIYVAEYPWKDWICDYAYYYSGLCFRTKEEAEQNKDKPLKIIDHYKEN